MPSARAGRASRQSGPGGGPAGPPKAAGRRNNNRWTMFVSVSGAGAAAGKMIDH
eukprot:gene1302-622_t